MRKVRNIRSSAINQQTFYYANWQEKETEYQTDDDGNILYVQVNGTNRPIEKEVPAHFSSPISFNASINMGGGNAVAKEFGIDESKYSATLITPKDLVNITNTSIIWFESEPTFKADGTVDETSCDYYVVKVSKSLLYDRYVLAKRVK